MPQLAGEVDEKVIAISLYVKAKGVQPGALPAQAGKAALDAAACVAPRTAVPKARTAAPPMAAWQTV